MNTEKEMEGFFCLFKYSPGATLLSTDYLQNPQWKSGTLTGQVQSS